MLCVSQRKVFLTSSISRVLKLLASCGTLIWDRSGQEAKLSSLKLLLKESSVCIKTGLSQSACQQIRVLPMVQMFPRSCFPEKP